MPNSAKKIIAALFILGTAALCFTQTAWAQKGTYATLEQILEQTFLESAPDAKTLWLPKELKQEFHAELGFEPKGLRQRYWQSEARTLWILEEIGKEYPITFAYVIESNRIISASVMEYQESRGGEIRHSFFQRQFEDALLTQGKLDRNIDGITGATLSVHAMTKMARQALWLHAAVIRQDSNN